MVLDVCGLILASIVIGLMMSKDNAHAALVTCCLNIILEHPKTNFTIKMASAGCVEWLHQKVVSFLTRASADIHVC